MKRWQMLMVAAVLTLGIQGLPFAQERDEVNIRGELPRAEGGAVDFGQVQADVDAALGEGARQVRFRDLTLKRGDAAALFLTPDPERNLLRQVGNTLPNDGVERQVKFRAIVDGRRVEARVKRQEDGTLRARIEGLNLTRLGRLDPGQREEFARRLARTGGFDRVRIRGVDAEGNQVRLEFRRDKGIVKNEVKRDHEHRRDRERKRDRDHDRDHRHRDRDRAERERDRHERVDRDEHRGRDRGRRVERPERRERPERVERAERPERFERPERRERVERIERAERHERHGGRGRR